MKALGPRLGAAVVLAVALLGAGAGTVAADSGLITLIDASETVNSERDSILEVDRTANAQTGSGTAGSDHDGSAVDAIQAILGEREPDDD
ncbi:hypothetical protein ABZ471_01670 [Streptomyces sp. NPDC005728]|uniref:hypothetical protein n=1 Tax=Streptomyces sp. NPDC005728 TaxID=3157054 RepID=UPI0033CF4D04